LVVPRQITAPRPAQTADDEDDNTKKKKKKKKVAAGAKSPAKKQKPSNLANTTGSSKVRDAPTVPASQSGPIVPDELKGMIIVFGGHPNALAEIKEILEGLEEGNDRSFSGPLATLFPGHQRPNPKPSMPGTGGHTTGQHEGTDSLGHSLEDIIRGFGAGGGSGDGRGGEEDGSSSESPDRMFGKDRSSSVGSYGIGAYDSGLPDPSGQASQDRRRNRGGAATPWRPCGPGCEQRESRRQMYGEGSPVWTETRRKNDRGTTTVRNDYRSGEQTWTYEPSSQARAEGRLGYRSTVVSDNAGHMLEYRTYESGTRVLVTWSQDSDGNWTRSRPVPIPDQPAPDDTAIGGGPRGGAFYRLTCGGLVCTYTPLSREEIASNMGLRINPGDPDGESVSDLDSGSRVGPRALTDPNPEDLGFSSGDRRPVGRGCGAGMIRC
jgi:hypothetical protein